VHNRSTYFIIAVTLFASAFSFAHAPVARASELSFVSDTIIDSRLSWPTNHTIAFRVATAIPPSGQIVIAFENEPFAIDPSFSYSDVGLAVSTSSGSSNFVERSLAATPDAIDDGVAVTTGSGPITITLSSGSGSGIAAGSYVRVLLGTNAPSGVYQITNPSSTASYRILLNSYNAVGAPLDYGAAIVAILPGIGVDTNTDKVNPAVLSAGAPTGTIPSNVSGVLVSFDTDTYATCRYATSSGILFDDMTNTTVDNSLGTFHSFTIYGITKGQTYTFYARCQDFAGNQNPNDYVISFIAGNPTGTGLGGGTGGTSGGSSGGGGGGGGEPYPEALSAPSLVISGTTAPGAAISLLEDGSSIPVVTTADGSGNFSVNVLSILQGTYSFTVQASKSGSLFSSYTATISLVAGTTNNISGVVLPPGIDFSTSTVGLGKTITINGFGEPSSTIDLVLTSQAGLGTPFEATATVAGDGTWSYAFSSVGFPADTYQLKAQTIANGVTESNFSAISFLGIGEQPFPKLKIGDMNGDGKVNLVDFSIMLTHWGTSYSAADLNGDGTVDLPDLSILLFNWTG
jgi:hypothetical protein